MSKATGLPTAGPLVSIVVPAFNNEKTIEDTLSSLTGQDYRPIEVEVVVDGGSSDDTREVVERVRRRSEGLIRIIDVPPMGRSAARNVGWRQIRGEIVFFADADDLYDSHYVSRAIEYLLGHPDAGGVTLTGLALQLDSTVSAACREVHSLINQKRIESGRATPVWAWVYTKNALERVRGFDEALDQGEDQDLFIRITDQGYKIGLIRGVNWHHTHKGNFLDELKGSYRAGFRRNAFLLKHKRYREIVVNVALTFSTVLLLVMGFVTLEALLALGILVLFLLGASLFRVLRQGWSTPVKRKSLLIYPFFRSLTFASAAFGCTVGLMKKAIGRT